MICPCGRDKEYKDCCGLVHQDIFNANSPEDLMRSRFTAFTKADGDFLLKSWHSETRKSTNKYSLVSWAMSVKWLKLEMVEVLEFNEEEGEVEFRAHYIERFKNKVIHERSKFVKENGHWVYLGPVQ